MEEPKHIVWCCEGNEYPEEVDVDILGEMTMPTREIPVYRHDKQWDVVQIRLDEAKGGPKELPVYRVLLRSHSRAKD